DVKAGIVTAKITATGSVFQFKISDAKTSLSALRVGQAVYANFATHQVSVNPEAPCCTITSGPQSVVGRPGGVALAGAVRPTAMPPAPTVTFGAPQPYTPTAGVRMVGGGADRWSARTVTAVANGKSTSAQLIHVRG